MIRVNASGRNVYGSSQADALTGCSLTIHREANGYLVATLERYRWRGNELAILLYMPMAQDKCPL